MLHLLQFQRITLYLNISTVINLLTGDVRKPISPSPRIPRPSRPYPSRHPAVTRGMINCRQEDGLTNSPLVFANASSSSINDTRSRRFIRELFNIRVKLYLFLYS